MKTNLFPQEITATLANNGTTADATIHVKEDTGSDVTGDGSAAHPYASLAYAGRDYWMARIRHQIRILVHPRDDGDPYDGGNPSLIAPILEQGGSFAVVAVGDPAPLAGPYTAATVTALGGAGTGCTRSGWWRTRWMGPGSAS